MENFRLIETKLLLARGSDLISRTSYFITTLFEGQVLLARVCTYLHAHAPVDIVLIFQMKYLYFLADARDVW